MEDSFSETNEEREINKNRKLTHTWIGMSIVRQGFN